nr:DUF3068 domain-containing protein [Corynebacterium lactis]
MLSRSRIVSILLIGLGAALIAVGVLLPKVINADPKLPLDLPATSYTMRAAEGVSTKLTPEGKREEVVAPLRRQLHGELIQPADANKVSLRVGVTEMRELPPEVAGTDPLQELIDANIWTFTIDRLTGEFLAPATLVDRMAGVPRAVDVTGHWVKFPAGTEQKEYPVFDDFMHDSVPAAFVAEEDRGGNKILHFRQTIAKTNLAQKYRSYVSQVMVDDKSGFLQYEGTRDWWVEPHSGSVIDVAENINLWWETREGEPIMTYFRFDGKMSEADSSRLLAGTLRVFKTPKLQPWSIGLITGGAILMFFAIVGAVRPASRRKAKEGDSATGDQPDGRVSGEARIELADAE